MSLNRFSIEKTAKQFYYTTAETEWKGWNKNEGGKDGMCRKMKKTIKKELHRMYIYAMIGVRKPRN